MNINNLPANFQNSESDWIVLYLVKKYNLLLFNYCLSALC